MAAPRTGFEQRDYTAPWTSREEETSYLTDLLAFTDKVTMDVVGESVDGHPMRVLSIGTGPRHVLFTAQQHGGEVAGREAMLTVLREWATTTDPNLLDYLSRVTVHIMPTCHPDNFSIRENTNGVNLNRDHVQLTQPETQAIHAVIRDYQPDLIVDWHEGTNIASDAATAPSLHLAVDSQILSLSADLHDATGAALNQAGYSSEMYQGPTNMMRGPENMHNSAGVQNAVGLLVESKRTLSYDGDAEHRYRVHLAAVDGVWRWHRANLHTVASTVQAARTRQARRRDPIVLQVETFTTGPVIDPLPTGYRLTPEQWDAVALHRDRFSLIGEPSGDDYIISTAQANQTVIVYLLDPSSPQKIVSGMPEGLPAPVLPIPAGKYRLKFRHNGVTYPATLKVKP